MSLIILNNYCKYCADDSSFPSYASSLRRSVRQSRDRIMDDMLHAESDPAFKKIHETKYCCDNAKYDAEDIYNKSSEYFKIDNQNYDIEPQIHSHITDILPEGHYLAYETVDCKTCHVMLHADNNECMQTWIETGKGNYCLKCFMALSKEKNHNVLEDEYALKLNNKGNDRKEKK